jgi:YbgC/YbaW family acyl-CoA thioester hydrolase
MKPDEATLQYRVCYADTDAAGVIYHGKYIEMAERSRTELIERAGLPVESLKLINNIGFVVKKIISQYNKFGILNDVLVLNSSVISMTPVRSWWLTEIKKNKSIICNVFAEIIYFNKILKCPQVLNDDIITVFREYNIIANDVNIKKYPKILSI